MKTTLRRLFLIPLALLLVTGCDLSSSAGTKQFHSIDGESVLEAPADWTPMELNEEAELQIGHSRANCYVVVLSESKEDLDEMTAERHSEITRQILFDASDKAELAAGPNSFTINGHPAVQYEILATVEGTNVNFIHTTIDGSDKFHQVLAWTLRSRFSKYRDRLETIVNSFREVEP